MSPKKFPMVYKCQVWWRAGVGWKPVRSDAYGSFKEYDNIDAAMRDKAALKMMSMKGQEPAGRFFVNVIEYPKGYPPEDCECELFFSLGGD